MAASGHPYNPFSPTTHSKSEAICFHGRRRAPPKCKHYSQWSILDTPISWAGPRCALEVQGALRNTYALTHLGGPDGECRRLYGNAVRAKVLYGCPIGADKLNQHIKTVLSSRRDYSPLGSRGRTARRSSSAIRFSVVLWRCDHQEFKKVLTAKTDKASTNKMGFYQLWELPFHHRTFNNIFTDVEDVGSATKNRS
ncbi:unnamed protein product [Pieris macdunnoughi]|uniref:Uncharacterized protein n=1 Tax=Pieris macdunnoughi TaxID=345717 RepID=A0A821UAM9_9NEOP|nr:unnamed protein product [Pieris macdunnoughi]